MPTTTPAMTPILELCFDVAEDEGAADLVLPSDAVDVDICEVLKLVALVLAATNAGFELVDDDDEDDVVAEVSVSMDDGSAASVVLESIEVLEEGEEDDCMTIVAGGPTAAVPSSAVDVHDLKTPLAVATSPRLSFTANIYSVPASTR